MSLGKPVCQWPGHHHWIAGGIITEAGPLEDQHGRKGTSGQPGQNQGPDIWAGVGCASEVCKDPKGVSTNYIFCDCCSSWIHKKRSGILSRLKSDVSFRCKRCTGQAKPKDGKLMTEVTVGREKLEVVPSFCYLGDCLYSGGGCEFVIITRCRVAWGTFNELLAVLTSRSFPITSRGRVYNSCVRSAMLHASKPVPQPCPTCIVCTVTTELWFAGYGESPPRAKSARRISWGDAAWRSGKGTHYPPSQMNISLRLS